MAQSNSKKIPIQRQIKAHPYIHCYSNNSSPSPEPKLIHDIRDENPMDYDFASQQPEMNREKEPHQFKPPKFDKNKLPNRK